MVLKNSNTYLHLAAQTGQNNAFKKALSEEEDKNIKNDYGEIPFHLACKKGCFKIVELLLESTNLNINAKDNHGCTGFIRACQEGHSKVVKI
jgi:ankyrin repeat protein